MKSEEAKTEAASLNWNLSLLLKNYGQSGAQLRSIKPKAKRRALFNHSSRSLFNALRMFGLGADAIIIHLGYPWISCR